ncbi:MAG: hypothetical protein KBA24_02690 [Dysgonomonadaceae bacterium]|nr:hypothetical protein [Dysgonamonadaceae bacterium]
MTTMVLVSSLVVVRNIPLRFTIPGLGGVGCIVVWFFVPTAKENIENIDNQD